MLVNSTNVSRFCFTSDAHDVTASLSTTMQELYDKTVWISWPWPGCSFGWSIILYTKRLQV